MRRHFRSAASEAIADGIKPSSFRTAGAWIAAIIDGGPTILPAACRRCSICRHQHCQGHRERHLDAYLRFCPKAHELRRFILQFRAMMRWRSAKKLGTWIKAAAASEFRFTAQFAATLRRDLEAVQTIDNNALEQRSH